MHLKVMFVDILMLQKHGHISSPLKNASYEPNIHYSDYIFVSLGGKYEKQKIKLKTNTVMGISSGQLLIIKF